MRNSIENDYLKVTVDTYGAELVSVFDKKKNEEMMWQADPKVWERHGPILFPYCGKLKDDKYTLDGKEYKGAKHGFMKDMEHTLVSNNGNSMTFVFHSNEETLKLLPRSFDFETIFTLDNNKLIYSVRVTNKSDKEMKFGLGFHPAFNIPFDNKHKTEDYELRFDTPQTAVVKDNYTSGPFGGLVNGEKYNLTENSVNIPLDDHMFDKDSLCLSELTAKTISLVEKDSGRMITVNIEKFPYVLLWSQFGGQLQFLCIEPWFNVQDTAESSGNWDEKECAASINPKESWQADLEITYNR